MLLEAIGESFYNSEIFKELRQELCLLKPVRDLLWDSSVVGRIVKIFSHAMFGAVEGWILGGLAGGAIAGGSSLIAKKAWVSGMGGTLHDVGLGTLAGALDGQFIGMLYGTGKYLDEESQDSNRIFGKIMNVFAKTLLGAATGGLIVSVSSALFTGGLGIAIGRGVMKASTAQIFINPVSATGCGAVVGAIYGAAKSIEEPLSVLL